MRLARRSRSRHGYLRPCVLILLSFALKKTVIQPGHRAADSDHYGVRKGEGAKDDVFRFLVATGTSLPCKSRLTSSLDSKKTPQRQAGNYLVPVTAGNFLLAHAKVIRFTLASTQESLGSVLPLPVQSAPGSRTIGQIFPRGDLLLGSAEIRRFSWTGFGLWRLRRKRLRLLLRILPEVPTLVSFVQALIPFVMAKSIRDCIKNLKVPGKILWVDFCLRLIGEMCPRRRLRRSARCSRNSSWISMVLGSLPLDAASLEPGMASNASFFATTQESTLRTRFGWGTRPCSRLPISENAQVAGGVHSG